MPMLKLWLEEQLQFQGSTKMKYIKLIVTCALYLLFPIFFLALNIVHRYERFF